MMRLVSKRLFDNEISIVPNACPWDFLWTARYDNVLKSKRKITRFHRRKRLSARPSVRFSRVAFWRVVVVYEDGFIFHKRFRTIRFENEPPRFRGIFPNGFRRNRPRIGKRFVFFYFARVPFAPSRTGRVPGAGLRVGSSYTLVR